jgi:D-alanine-D-alanine ligase
MSAQSVMAAIDREKYDVIPVGITKQGRWLVGDAMQALTAGSEEMARPATLLPDPHQATLMELQEQSGSPTSLLPEAALDVVIPVLHGPYGEDGTVQGLLELAGIPYVGAGVVGSAVGMDKAIFKQIMVANQIPVLPWRLVRRSEWQADRECTLSRLETALSYPMFTKPANLGSSVGISKCRDREELAAGLDQASDYDRRVVVEQGVNARELEVSVLGNDDPVASVVGEIRPRREFYDYVAKYISDDSELIIPAALEPELERAVRELAVRAYVAIDCAGLGRVDMLLDRDSDRIYLNEINTMPGFTRISMYPKLWEASGLSYGELLDRLIELALDRHQDRMQSRTDYSAPEAG